MHPNNPYQTPDPQQATARDIANMEFPIRAELTYELKDYVRSFSLNDGPFRFIARIVMLIFGAASLWYGIQLYIQPNDLGQFFIVCGVVLVLVSIFMNKIRASSLKSQLKSVNGIGEHVQLEISPEYLRTITEFEDVRIKWNGFIKLKEAPDMILAYRSKQFFNLLPLDKLPPDAVVALRHFFAESRGAE